MKSVFQMIAYPVKEIHLTNMTSSKTNNDLKSV